MKSMVMKGLKMAKGIDDCNDKDDILCKNITWPNKFHFIHKLLFSIINATCDCKFLELPWTNHKKI